MPRETEVTIEISGKPAVVKMRCLTEREKRKISEECHMKYNPETRKIEGEFMKLGDMSVDTSIIKASLPPGVDILDLDAPEFDKLRKAYNKYLIGPTKEEVSFLSTPSSAEPQTEPSNTRTSSSSSGSSP
jgi:hypothetical protein